MRLLGKPNRWASALYYLHFSTDFRSTLHLGCIQNSFHENSKKRGKKVISASKIFSRFQRLRTITCNWFLLHLIFFSYIWFFLSSPLDQKQPRNEHCQCLLCLHWSDSAAGGREHQWPTQPRLLGSCKYHMIYHGPPLHSHTAGLFFISYDCTVALVENPFFYSSPTPGHVISRTAK